MDAKPPFDAGKSQPIYNLGDVSPSSKTPIDFEVSIIAKGVFQERGAAVLSQKDREVTSEIDIDLQDQVLVVQEVVKEYVSLQKNRPDRPEIGLTIGFFCDIDAIDHNGAISSGLVISIEQNLPFITTRSMLRGSGIIDHETWDFHREDVEDALLKTADQWEIFQRGEFLVCIPKSLEPTKSGREKLEALDFTTDGSLRQISVGDLFQEPQKITEDIHPFFTLFQENPQIDKVFYLAGHGGSSSVGGLRSENYAKFTDFLEKQRCKGFAITSCRSGGESSLLNISEKEEKHPFLTVVRSIGDFPTKSGQTAEKNLRLFYSELADFLETSPQTVGQLRKRLEKIEEGDSKIQANAVQVYFPHTANIPGGFRPLTEGGHALSLTYVALKKHEIGGGGIEVYNKEFLEIYPLTVALTVLCKEKDPVLLSQVPGSSHHFIETIILSQESPAGFIQNTIQFHKKSAVKVDKGFFIGRIESEKGIYEGVAIQVSPQGSRYAYQEDGRYFLSDGVNANEISPFQYARFFQEAEEATKPKSAAIRAATAGLDQESLFHESVQRFSRLETSTQLTQEEKGTLLFQLLKEGDVSRAMELFEKENIDPHIQDAFGIPLSFIVLEKNELSFFQKLLARGLDPNVQNLGDKNTLLHRAVLLKNEEAVKLLLSFSDIDLNVKNIAGQTPIMQAMDMQNLQLFSLLHKRGASLNETDKQGVTNLGKYAFLGRTKAVQFLLEAGADPNAGKPSPLAAAARSCNVEVIEMLLKAGAKPFEKGEDGFVPFLEIIARGSLEMVNLLLKHPDCNLAVTDEEGNCPAIVALISGDAEKIRVLAQSRAPFPRSFDTNTQQTIKQVFERLHTLKDYASIKNLLQWNGSHSPALDIFVVSYFLSRNPSFLEELIKEGLVNPNAKLPNGNSIFYSLFQLAAKNPEKHQKLIEACIESGVNLNEVRQTKPKQTLLEVALSANNASLAKLLLHKGANPTGLLSAIIELDNLELVQLACEKGASVHGVTGISYPLEDAAMKIDDRSVGEIFRWLVEQGADLNAVGFGGTSPFLIVVESANLKLIQYCLEHGAKCISPSEKKQLLIAAKNSPHPVEVLRVLSKYIAF